jgi:transposase
MIKEDLRMSIKEADRLGIMRQIDNKKITILRGSEQLGISYRQTKRIRQRYLKDGEKGLISRKRHRQSNRKISDKVRSRVIGLLKTIYVGFGPTLAEETLEKRDKLKISAETLRKWMKEEGIWQAKKRKERRVYHRRQRRDRFGELLEGDGSPHDWFEGRGEKCTLLQFVDDATSKTTAALFAPSETTQGYLDLLKDHLQKHGRPISLYVDKHSVFRVNREELKKGVGITHFGRVVKELGIELICAHSPQAKGRVERKNGVMQDRLVKEMRLQGINSIEEANKFLPGFLEELNQRFGKQAFSSEDAHRPLRPEDNLEEIFIRKDKRKLSKNLTFQHKGTLYMVETKSPNRLRHATVEVHWKDNIATEVRYNGKKLDYKKWDERPYQGPAILNAKEIGAADSIGKKTTKPSMQHPWR